ncbi:MAG: Gfo/Idh/MocA family protein [Puniceicoccaceae bacterium]
MSEQSFKGVCVGAGYFSRFQYQAWNELPETEILAVCNRSVDKAEVIARDFGIPNVYSIGDYEKMLDEQQPDFVDIITPPETHLPLVEAAINRGIAVICQKPLAPTWAECRRMEEIVKASPVPFMVHENWRWQPWYREVKQLMDADAIGEFFHCAIQTRLGDGWGEDAYLARQPFFRDYPRLFIYETGVHFLDTFRFLFGEVDSIHASIAKRNPVIKGEDSAMLFCKFAGGGTALLDANRYNESEADNPRYTFGKIRIEGSKGHLEIDFDGSITIKPLGKPTRGHEYTPSRDGFAGNCVHAVQRHFVDCLIAGQPFESTISDYLQSVKLVEAAYASAATDSVITPSTYNPS